MAPPGPGNVWSTVLLTSSMLAGGTRRWATACRACAPDMVSTRGNPAFSCSSIAATPSSTGPSALTVEPGSYRPVPQQRDSGLGQIVEHRPHRDADPDVVESQRAFFTDEFGTELAYLPSVPPHQQRDLFAHDAAVARDEGGVTVPHLRAAGAAHDLACAVNDVVHAARHAGLAER